MEYEQASLRIETYEKFEWIIPNFSKRETKKLYSETFVLGGYPWRILLFPKGNNVGFLSIYLDAGVTTNLPKGWTRDASFSLSLYNQLHSDLSLTKATNYQFNARENDRGFSSFITLAEFHNPRYGFLVNDTCTIIAEVHVLRSEHENHVDQVTFPAAQHHAGHMEMEVPRPQSSNPFPFSIEPPIITHKEISSTLVDERADFRGLGQIEKIYISLLEEACSQHPSLVEFQQKRSREFTQWAFTALGRVLHFLDTKRVKDMNYNGCADLKNLWEELEAFRFDLTWLEPHVQSALGMKIYIGKGMQLENLKANMTTSELELKRQKAKVAATETDLDIAERDLLKVTESLEGRHLDAKLGYGRP